MLILVLQGALVAGVHTLAFFGDFSWSHLVVAAAVLLVRTVIIPTYIVKIMHQLDMGHGDRTRRYHPGFLVQMAAVVIGAFLISDQLSRVTPVNVIPLGAAVAGIAAGGLLIVRRRLLLAHVVGFLIIENGLFLLGIGVQAQMPWTIELAGLLDLFVLIFLMEMPWTIELAGLLDLFVLIFLMGIAINQLKSHFPEDAELTVLQD